MFACFFVCLFVSMGHLKVHFTLDGMYPVEIFVCFFVSAGHLRVCFTLDGKDLVEINTVVKKEKNGSTNSFKKRKKG